LPTDAACLAAQGDPRSLATAIDRALAAPPPGATRYVDGLAWTRVGAVLDEHWRR